MAVVTIKINYLVEFISKTITATALSHIINELRFKRKANHKHRKKQNREVR